MTTVYPHSPETLQPTEAPPGAFDVVADVLDQLASARRGECREIRVPAGVHRVDAARLPRRLCNVSNHDSGVRPVLFDLRGLEGITIRGEGAELLFDGDVVPMLLEDCRHITVRGLTIDWTRPFLSQGEVRRTQDGLVELRFDERYPYEIRDGRLVFTGPGYESSGLVNLLAFDARRRETAFRAQDHYGLARELTAEAGSGPGVVRLRGAFPTLPEPGQIMVVKHHGRTSPGFCVSRCRGVTFEDVTVYHAGGMGFIAQASRDVSLRRCRVMVRPGSDRVFSSHADATHFVDCSGRIELIDCTFANQMDDATNIHGIFRRVVRQPAGDCIDMAVMHEQQRGVDTFAEGDTLAFFDRRTFAPLGRAELVSSEAQDRRVTRYRLSRAVDLPEGEAVAMRWDHDVDVVIRGCVCENNRARGLLVSSLGRVLIEDNRLHVPGTAVQCCFDASSWYESGPIEDVTVRGNTFDNCMYGVWGPALFAVNPHIDPARRGVAANGKLRIVDNLIRTADPRLVSAHSIESLVFKNNRVIPTDAYPRDRDGPAISLGAAVAAFETDLPLDDAS